MELYVLEFHAAWNLVEVLCYFLFFSAFLRPGGSRIRSVAAVMVVWLLLQLNQEKRVLMGIYYWILPLTLCFAASWAVYAGRWDLRFFASIVCYLLLGITENMAIFGVCMVMGCSFSELSRSTDLYLLTVSSAELLALVLSGLVFRFVRHRDLGSIRPRWILLAVLFPTVSAVMATVIYYSSMNTVHWTGPAALFSMLLGAANAAVFCMVFAVERATQREQEVELLQQQISLQTANFESLENSYRTQRKATHDFEHHLQVLSDLMDTGETEAARKHLRQLRANRSLQVFTVKSRHPVIDVILNQKYQMAQSHDVRMHIEVNDLSSVTVPADCLVVVLSNLLDNAIEACMHLANDRQIFCRILAEDNLYLSIRNTSQPVLIGENGTIRTTKASQRDHGYGLPAVGYILDEIGAEYTCSYRDGWFQFVAEIPMYHKNGSA